MINIRKNTFETNSSSCHSIILSYKDRGYDYDLPVDSNGTFHVKFGEFGWGPDVLRTPYDKISYYITDQIQISGCNWFENEEDFEKELKEFYNNQKIVKLIEYIKSKCPQVKDVKFEFGSKFYKLGYVDHDSVGTSDDLPIERYIFNNGAIIIIDNDNNFNFWDYQCDETQKGNAPKKDPEELFEV